MKRECRNVPLGKKPLILVLCQVQFSPVRKMVDYIPAIQEEFRRHGYPIERTGKAQHITITSKGLQTTEQDQWEYRTRDETRSILVTQDSIVLQTTSYEQFETFAEQLLKAIDTVFKKSEHNEFGVVERIGLRYVDMVIPSGEKDYRFYVQSGLHGIPDDVFQSASHRLQIQSMGITNVGSIEGKMLVKLLQNDQGHDLPPDLMVSAPKHDSKATDGVLCTLIDMDHFVEGSFDPDAKSVVEITYKLHDKLVETFHKNVVTPEAIEEWK